MDHSALADLATRARADLAAMAYPARTWLPPPAHPSGAPAHNVLIAGGGQSGVGVAHLLARDGVDCVSVVDAAPAGKEGPWRNYARMATLRTPKELVGLEGGLPALSVRAWYAAAFGAEAWDKLGRIPREHWAAYLDWFRATAGVQVRTRVELLRLEPAGNWIACDLAIGGRPMREYARHVVLAHGYENAGAWALPDWAEALPAAIRAHSNGPIDFDALKGKRVAVLGNGASAFDNARAALRAGARRVDLCFRRERLPEINPHRWAEFAGYLRHYPDLPDAAKWALSRRFRLMDQPPTADAVDGCKAFANFAVHPGRGWTGAEGTRIETTMGPLDADFLIFATGIRVDLALRPELAAIEADIARWGDRHEPAEPDPVLSAWPYLGPGFEFTAKPGRAAPWLARIHQFGFAAGLSHGAQCASVSGHKYALPRLAAGVTRGLFGEMASELCASLDAYDVREKLL
ncbi:MAG: NAD(P)/FAD-dependent oxidoreductase [Tagaea sp.]|nr:NAD(P)/FAD-dependent oxidoreductase [Tagaea sp.]